MKTWKKVFAVLTATLALTIGGACMAYAAEGEINVNGVGIVQADPDTAKIHLSIETNKKTAEAAQTENNKIVQAVTKAMLELNVPKDQIVTDYTSVYPTYYYDDETGKRTVTGYRSNTELEVTTKDIDHTGKYIDAALKAGATGNQGLSFSIADQSVYYGQALQAAVKNAEKSAASIAQAYGKTLGPVKSVTELSRNAYQVQTANLARTEEKAVEDSAAGFGTDISYGKIEITANISATYQF